MADRGSHCKHCSQRDCEVMLCHSWGKEGSSPASSTDCTALVSPFAPAPLFCLFGVWAGGRAGGTRGYSSAPFGLWVCFSIRRLPTGLRLRRSRGNP